MITYSTKIFLRKTAYIHHSRKEATPNLCSLAGHLFEKYSRSCPHGGLSIL